MTVDESTTEPPVPEFTGPEAITHALGKVDLDTLETQHRDTLKAGQVSKRAGAISTLNVIEGLRRNKMTPNHLVISKVPVLPAAFRPFSAVGDTFIPGDANELYGDVFKLKEAYTENEKTFGKEGSRQAGYDLYNAVKATYGYGDPVSPKLQQRGVAGFLKTLSGSNPKFSFVQRKLLSKNQDQVARGVIGVDPELSLDEIGVPEDMAWNMYNSYVIRRLVQAGIGQADALKQAKDRTDLARKMLLREMDERPVVYSRAPAWHKFNTISGRPKLIEGSTIAINPLVTTGHNADFDGDTINLHVPASAAAVKESKDILMPSKMLFSIRDQDKVVPEWKHEQILGMYAASQRPAKNTYNFNTEEEALDAIRKGKVALSDEIVIAGKR